MNYHLETQQHIEMINTPGIPWGKVLGYSWTTDRERDYSVGIWKAAWRWLKTGKWSRTECRLVTSKDKEWNPTPYKVTHIL